MAVGFRFIAVSFFLVVEVERQEIES